MKLNTASDLFNRLKMETDKKSEIKIYEKFSELISKLENRNFETEELHSIETKLDELGLDSKPENRARFYRQKLNEFKKYLKDSFSLISNGYYTGIGMALGVAFGAAFGSFSNLGTGIGVGIAMGLAIGASLDAKAKKENRVL